MEIDAVTEEWRPVVGYEGEYEVSSFGRVRNARSLYMLACSVNKTTRYPGVSLYRQAPERPRTFKVHRLVATAFIPNPDNLAQVNHMDCDRTNNHASNLEWVSHKRNIEHGIQSGRSTAATNPRKPHKLSTAGVADIRARHDAGETIKSIAASYPHMDFSYVQKVAKRAVRIYENDGSARLDVPLEHLAKRAAQAKRRLETSKSVEMKWRARRIIEIYEQRLAQISSGTSGENGKRVDGEA
jgi:hypothetical protein